MAVVTDFGALDKLDGLITAQTGKILYDYALHASGNVVEIGSYAGKSTCFLAAGVRDRGDAGGHVYAVDHWDGDSISWRRNVISELPQATLRDFRAQIDLVGLSDTITPIRSYSVIAAHKWEYGEIGLLYIDGDHNKESVINDVCAWLPHLADNAVMLFDDYGVTKNRGVSEAIEYAHGHGMINLVDVVDNGRVAVCQAVK